MLRITVTVSAPDPASIGRAAAVLREGGIAAIPTDTLYGLAVNPFDRAAVAKLFTIKNRAIEKAVPLVASDIDQLRSRIGALPAIAERLASHFWPGPLTLVVAAPAALAPDVTGGRGTVGIRIPAHEVTQALCAAAGTPLTATSANISGRPATDDPDVVAAELGARIDLLVDAGRTAGGAPSTIVDVTAGEPRLIRAGAIEWHAVLAATTTG
jgi:L-threonylcarbamoyladenylate synthase